MHKRIVVPLLATLGLAGGLAAVEPSVATPFEIRHDAEELLDDLQNLQKHQGESEVLLERVQTLLAAHGDSMIAKGELCAPLAEFFATTLARLGLSADFARAFNAPASRRLHELEGGGASEAELRHLAQSYPGTTAATAAWRRLADQAWDSGRLGLYLECAAKAGEPAEVALSKRMAAATELLAPARAPELPASLDGLEERWPPDLGEVSARPTGRGRAGRRARRAQGFADRFMLTTGPGDLTAASDGLKFFLFDHLVGRIQGEVRALGNAPLGISQCRPVASRDGFIALGWLEDHATLLCLDHLGEVRWHWNTQTIGSVPALSAPVVLDDVVVIAAMASNNQDGAELRVMGFRTDSGRQQFSTVVARIPTPRQFGLNGYEAMARAPSLAVVGGYLLVLSNNGVLARVGIDGNVQRIWSYPTAQEEVDDGLGNQRAASRSGALVSDGAYALASPADSPGLVLLLGPGDAEPRRYLGDGANGEVLDVADGCALLGSGSTIALLDLATRSARWTQPFIGRGGMQGRIGQGRALVLSREAMGLFDLAKGELISNRGLAEPMSMSATNDLLMLATADKVSGRGKGASFLERLTAAAAAHPGDYRPWATLASLQESRGDREKAFASLSAALARGAPPDCAERAARLVRSQLELAVGDPKAFLAPLAKLESLVAFADHIKGEIAFWNARHAELLGDLPRAVQGYRTALDSPSHLVHLKDNIDADIHALARAGLVRAKAIPPAPAEVAAVPARPLAEWTQPTHRTEPTVIGNDLVLGYGDGFLLAQRISDGKEAWRRTPERPVLGVISRAEGGRIAGEGAAGIPIEVVQGSSAAGAGMQSGDLLTSFLGHPTLDFTRDLRGSVIAMQPRSPFTATVQRGGKQIELSGQLGGEPVEPLMANRTSVLIWPTQSSVLHGVAGRINNKPEGVWFAVHDLITGARLLRYSLSPPTAGGGMPPRPLLTDGDLVLTIEASDLVCLPVRGNPDPENIQPLWRLPMGENTIDQVHLLGEGLLWLPEDGRNRITLVELATGRTRFVLPEDVGATPLLADDDVLSLGDDNHLSCWDIGLARLRWRTTQSYGHLLAVRGDSVFVFNENNQPGDARPRQWRAAPAVRRLGDGRGLARRPRPPVPARAPRGPQPVAGADRPARRHHPMGAPAAARARGASAGARPRGLRLRARRRPAGRPADGRQRRRHPPGRLAARARERGADRRAVPGQRRRRPARAARGAARAGRGAALHRGGRRRLPGRGRRRHPAQAALAGRRQGRLRPRPPAWRAPGVRAHRARRRCARGAPGRRRSDARAARAGPALPAARRPAAAGAGRLAGSRPPRPPQSHRADLLAGGGPPRAAGPAPGRGRAAGARGERRRERRRRRPVVAASGLAPGRLRALTAMIIGLGTDLVGVARIAGVYARHGEHFLARTYSGAERAYCLAARDPAERLAARWAAKEACMKALGTGWAQGVGFTDISLLADAAGVPRLALAGGALRVAQRLGACRWHCSVSHSDGFAIAVVVLEAGADPQLGSAPAPASMGGP